MFHESRIAGREEWVRLMRGPHAIWLARSGTALFGLCAPNHAQTAGRHIWQVRGNVVPPAVILRRPRKGPRHVPAETHHHLRLNLVTPTMTFIRSSTLGDSHTSIGMASSSARPSRSCLAARARRRRSCGTARRHRRRRRRVPRPPPLEVQYAQHLFVRLAAQGHPRLKPCCLHQRQQLCGVGDQGVGCAEGGVAGRRAVAWLA